MDRTSDFGSDNEGSNPSEATKNRLKIFQAIFFQKKPFQKPILNNDIFHIGS